ncbi:MAG: chemotaxis protein CheE [Brevundimonas sp.]|nr:chemotaxis protein CheE [Brevundimonas sp.]
MTVVVTIPRKSRLSAMIDKPGGVSVGVALIQARENLEALQFRSLKIVADRIAELARLTPPTADEPDPLGRRLQAYGLANAVIDAAHPFERDDLCAVAAGLCDLIDAAPAGRPFDWRIVTVHAQAMQLILSLPPEAADIRAEILASLGQVLAKKIPAQPAD